MEDQYLRLFDMLSFIFVWWFGLALFDDAFRLRTWHWAVSGLLALCIGFSRTAYLGLHSYWIPQFNLVVTGLIIMVMLHIAWVALAGRHEDLIEKRRKMRVRFVVSLVALTVIAAIVERLALPLGYSQELSLWLTYATILGSAYGY